MADGNSVSLPLSLHVGSDSWRLFDCRRRDPKFALFAETVLKRDDYTCRYCGFRSKLHQEVVNIDGNWMNNRISNLATACCFCTQCFFLSMVGNSVNSGGRLIYLPELTQNELNALVHVLFCMLGGDISYARIAKDYYQKLAARSEVLIDKLKLDILDDAAVTGLYLSNLTDKNREKLEKALFGSVRLLPLAASFTQAIADWNRESAELIESLAKS